MMEKSNWFRSERKDFILSRIGGDVMIKEQSKRGIFEVRLPMDATSWLSKLLCEASVGGGSKVNYFSNNYFAIVGKERSVNKGFFLEISILNKASKKSSTLCILAGAGKSGWADVGVKLFNVIQLPQDGSQIFKNVPKKVSWTNKGRSFVDVLKGGNQSEVFVDIERSQICNFEVWKNFIIIESNSEDSEQWTLAQDLIKGRYSVTCFRMLNRQTAGIWLKSNEDRNELLWLQGIHLLGSKLAFREWKPDSVCLEKIWSNPEEVEIAILGVPPRLAEVKTVEAIVKCFARNFNVVQEYAKVGSPCLRARVFNLDLDRIPRLMTLGEKGFRYPFRIRIRQDDFVCVSPDWRDPLVTGCEKVTVGEEEDHPSIEHQQSKFCSLSPNRRLPIIQEEDEFSNDESEGNKWVVPRSFADAKRNGKWVQKWVECDSWVGPVFGPPHKKILVPTKKSLSVSLSNNFLSLDDSITKGPLLSEDEGLEIEPRDTVVCGEIVMLNPNERVNRREQKKKGKKDKDVIKSSKHRALKVLAASTKAMNCKIQHASSLNSESYSEISSSIPLIHYVNVNRERMVGSSRIPDKDKVVNQSSSVPLRQFSQEKEVGNLCVKESMRSVYVGVETSRVHEIIEGQGQAKSFEYVSSRVTHIHCTRSESQSEMDPTPPGFIAIHGQPVGTRDVGPWQKKFVQECISCESVEEVNECLKKFIVPVSMELGMSSRNREPFIKNSIENVLEGVAKAVSTDNILEDDDLEQFRNSNAEFGVADILNVD